LKAISKTQKSTNIQIYPTNFYLKILLFSPFFSQNIDSESEGGVGSCLFLYQKEKENKLVRAKSF
jgi:hypothetical protein